MGRRALFLISLHLYKNNISGWDLWSTILQLYETQALSWYRHHGAVILRDDCRKAGPSIWDSFEAMGVYVGLRCGWSVCLWCFKHLSGKACEWPVPKGKLKLTYDEMDTDQSKVVLCLLAITYLQFSDVSWQDWAVRPYDKTMYVFLWLNGKFLENLKWEGIKSDQHYLLEQHAVGNI